jgi:23S rRNA (pseudouridine1915-N3)-methyltransferase
MKIEFWLTGKTKEAWVSQALDDYFKRCKRFGIEINSLIIPESRHKTAGAIKKDETERLLSRLEKEGRAFTILLDETGRQLTSIGFAELISRQQILGYSTIRFIVGGAFGVDPSLHQKVDFTLSLSSMTFPHQVVRVIFAEQLYRAFTILRGEGYHHE